MKKFSVLCFVCFSVLFLSCSHEENRRTDDEINRVEEEQNEWLGLHIVGEWKLIERQRDGVPQELSECESMEQFTFTKDQFMYQFYKKKKRSTGCKLSQEIKGTWQKKSGNTYELTDGKDNQKENLEIVFLENNTKFYFETLEKKRKHNSQRAVIRNIFKKQ